MTLKDFLDKYKKVIQRKEVCERLGISYSRLKVLEKGGAHKAMTKYAPLIEAMIPNCTDKIYIPPETDPTVVWQRAEKVPFTDEELNIIKEKAYLINYRTLVKILNGYLPTKYIHDKIMAKVYDDDVPTMYKKLIERFEKNKANENN